jgi:hypothetical protein
VLLSDHDIAVSPIGDPRERLVSSTPSELHHVAVGFGGIQPPAAINAPLPSIAGVWRRSLAIYVLVLLRLKPSGMLDGYPNLAGYVARGEARPAYQRAFAA